MTGEPVAIGAVEDRMIAGGSGAIAARIYVPEAAAGPMVVYFHGGGYVKGGIEEGDAFCRSLARATRRIVVSVGYRLAPEHPFPAALDDAVAATAWAFRHAAELGGDGHAVAVCGESAGGNLAAVVCHSPAPAARRRSHSRCCSSPSSTSRCRSPRSRWRRPSAWCRATISRGTTANIAAATATCATPISPIFAKIWLGCHRR